MTNSAAEGPAVGFQGVHFRVNGRSLITGLSMEIHRGETMVLLGRSGSGKTTVVKLINGLLHPSEGAVMVEDRTTSAWDPVQLRRRTGYVIQEGGLFPHFTVERNVGLIPRLEGWPKERIKARVDEVLSMVGLDPNEFRGRYPHELSGGQRQLVGVARALAGDPPLLLMDEPFGSLDPITRDEIQHEFLGLLRRVRKTTILVTHDVREALLLSTRIALLDLGKLVGVYSPQGFLHSNDTVARQYAGALRTGKEKMRLSGDSNEPS